MRLFRTLAWLALIVLAPSLEAQITSEEYAARRAALGLILLNPMSPSSALWKQEEQALAELVTDADRAEMQTIIDDLDIHPEVVELCPEDQLATVVNGVDRIVEEVGPHLVELARVRRNQR